MNVFSQPVTWILLLPVLGWLVQCLIGGWAVRELGVARGRRLMGTLAVLPIAGAFALGVGIVQQLAKIDAHHHPQVLQYTLFEWVKVMGFSMPFEVRMDALSMTMVLVITGIGSLIHLYATGYMAEEKDYPRFFAYLNLFIAFMLVLVLGNNLGLLFIGWEGVGLCSYLLIGFWYKDLANSRAANKAFIVNRIGDVGLTIGMFLLVSTVFNHRSMLPAGETRLLSYDVLFPHLQAMLGENPVLTTAIALCLFVGAMGKSAQFPLHAEEVELVGKPKSAAKREQSKHRKREPHAEGHFVRLVVLVQRVVVLMLVFRRGQLFVGEEESVVIFAVVGVIAMCVISMGVIVVLVIVVRLQSAPPLFTRVKSEHHHAGHVDRSQQGGTEANPAHYRANFEVAQHGVFAAECARENRLFAEPAAEPRDTRDR